ncbi:MAG TPA: hypothetical protein DCR46_02890 [Cytophagales bacterium]|nr:hypothetical protein [Cytophagales bacterium]
MIEMYLNNISASNKTKVNKLRKIILQASPKISETIKFKTLFYTYKGLFCYFSIETKTDKLYIGFCDGYLLSDPKLYLTNKYTKKIRKLYVDEITPAFIQILQVFLQEAIWVKDKILKK